MSRLNKLVFLSTLLFLPLTLNSEALAITCPPFYAGQVNNNGTVLGVGSGSVGSQVGIEDNTTVGAVDQGNSPPGVRGPGPVKIDGLGRADTPGAVAYNPLSDPNLKDRDKPVDVSKVDPMSSDFQKSLGRGIDREGQRGTREGISQPDSYTGGTKPPDKTNGTKQPDTSIFPSQPGAGSTSDPGMTGQSSTSNLPSSSTSTFPSQPIGSNPDPGTTGQGLASSPTSSVNPQKTGKDAKNPSPLGRPSPTIPASTKQPSGAPSGTTQQSSKSSSWPWFIMSNWQETTENGKQCISTTYWAYQYSSKEEAQKWVNVGNYGRLVNDAYGRGGTDVYGGPYSTKPQVPKNTKSCN